jgi:hypothetical protein
MKKISATILFSFILIFSGFSPVFASTDVCYFNAIINQNGSYGVAPVLTILRNDLSVTPTMTYDNYGDYSLVATGMFPVGQTIYTLNSSNDFSSLM